MEGLVPVEVPAEEGAGNRSGRRRAEVWAAAPAGQVCARSGEEPGSGVACKGEA